MINDSEFSEKVASALKLIEIDYDNGINEIESLACRGNIDAIKFVGFFLSEKSDSNQRAFPWLIISYLFGDSGAAWNLAMIYKEWGEIELMREWIDRAALGGEEDALAIQKENYDVEAFLARLR